MGNGRRLFSNRAPFTEIATAVRAAAAPRDVVVVGDDSCWSEISVKGPDGDLHLHAMQRRAPGDEYSRMILGLHNHFRPAAKLLGAQGVEILHKIAAAQLAIGVVAQPSFTHPAWLPSTIQAAALAGECIVFDGQRLWSADGSLLIDSQRG